MPKCRQCGKKYARTTVDDFFDESKWKTGYKTHDMCEDCKGIYITLRPSNPSAAVDPLRVTSTLPGATPNRQLKTAQQQHTKVLPVSPAGPAGSLSRTRPPTPAQSSRQEGTRSLTPQLPSKESTISEPSIRSGPNYPVRTGYSGFGTSNHHLVPGFNSIPQRSQPDTLPQTSGAKDVIRPSPVGEAPSREERPHSIESQHDDDENHHLLDGVYYIHNVMHQNTIFCSKPGPREALRGSAQEEHVTKWVVKQFRRSGRYTIQHVDGHLWAMASQQAAELEMIVMGTNPYQWYIKKIGGAELKYTIKHLCGELFWGLPDVWHGTSVILQNDQTDSRNQWTFEASPMNAHVGPDVIPPRSSHPGAGPYRLGTNPRQDNVNPTKSTVIGTTPPRNPNNTGLQAYPRVEDTRNLERYTRGGPTATEVGSSTLAPVRLLATHDAYSKPSDPRYNSPPRAASQQRTILSNTDGTDGASGRSDNGQTANKFCHIHNLHYSNRLFCDKDLARKSDVKASPYAISCDQWEIMSSAPDRQYTIRNVGTNLYAATEPRQGEPGEMGLVAKDQIRCQWIVNMVPETSPEPRYTIKHRERELYWRLTSGDDKAVVELRPGHRNEYGMQWVISSPQSPGEAFCKFCRSKSLTLL